MTTIPKLARTTVNLTPPQMSWLRREARRLGLTIGELLRRIIDDRREAS